jgi:EAL domain-containing protein (putative c-di-GMP-specific phosphodiesterase class I)
MGGDEFVILLPGLKREEYVVAVAHKLLETIARPCLINDRELLLEASIGVALYPRDGNDVGTLLKHADAAMYRAKDHGGNAFKFYKDELDAQVSRHFEIAGQLQNAIERNEFQMYYQPQFDLEQGKVTGAEALIRWQHPTMGMISPFEFIPIAEESNMVLKIGEWVAENVIRQCKAWQSEGLPLLSVAINISARQFDHSDIPRILSDLITRYDLNPALFTLELELTEGMLMKHPEHVIQTLNKLKAMNFDISIDDFGTGYSSLAYLKRFPIDKLKIDRSFVKDIPDDLDDVAIASAIIMMAHELGMKVVAEGVETEAQFALLKARGCDVIQGYLTGYPMTAQEFEALLRSGN